MEGDGGEDGELGGRIVAVDVGGGVGLGVAQALRVGEHLLEAQALRVHARKNVVRGPVHDAGDGEGVVADERVLERVDDGDAAGAGGLAADLDAGARRLPRERGDVAPEERLVGGDDVLAVCDGVLEDLGRGMVAADELDHDIDGGVGGDLAPIGGEGVRRKPQGVCALRVARAGFPHAHVDAVGREVVVVVLGDQADDAAAHRAESDDADLHGPGALLHGGSNLESA